MTDRVVVRPRRPEDIPALAEVLASQQPESRYPMRWPLPFPVEDFLVRPRLLAAWTAEDAGRPVGHVAVHGPDPQDPLLEHWSQALGRGADELGVLSILFVHPGARGSGLGGRLHDTAVDWLRESDLGPCLDVVPVHDAALHLYTGRGWREVGRGRPGWLPQGAPDVVAMVLDLS